MHVVLAPITYRLWTDLVRTGRLGSGDVPMWVWVFPVAYIVVAILHGSVFGRGTPARRPWARLFTGPDPAPRAWDHLFGSTPDGWIRLRLKSGTWLGGAFGRRPDGSRGSSILIRWDEVEYLDFIDA
jgi:hypothetical protein